MAATHVVSATPLPSARRRFAAMSGSGSSSSPPSSSSTVPNTARLVPWRVPRLYATTSRLDPNSSSASRPYSSGSTSRVRMATLNSPTTTVAVAAAPYRTAWRLMRAASRATAFTRPLWVRSSGCESRWTHVPSLPVAPDLVAPVVGERLVRQTHVLGRQGACDAWAGVVAQALEQLEGGSVADEVAA